MSFVVYFLASNLSTNSVHNFVNSLYNSMYKQHGNLLIEKLVEEGIAIKKFLPCKKIQCELFFVLVIYRKLF